MDKLTLLSTSFAAEYHTGGDTKSFFGGIVEAVTTSFTDNLRAFTELDLSGFALSGSGSLAVDQLINRIDFADYSRNSISIPEGMDGAMLPFLVKFEEAEADIIAADKLATEFNSFLGALAASKTFAAGDTNLDFVPRINVIVTTLENLLKESNSNHHSSGRVAMREVIRSPRELGLVLGFRDKFSFDASKKIVVQFTKQVDGIVHSLKAIESQLRNKEFSGTVQNAVVTAAPRIAKMMELVGLYEYRKSQFSGAVSRLWEMLEKDFA